MTTLPDLTDAARWNGATAEHRRTVAAEQDRLIEQEKGLISAALERALCQGEESLSYHIDGYKNKLTGDSARRLCAWVNSQPGYKCRFDSFSFFYELRIHFRVINGKLDVRRPPFWVRWFC